MSTLSVTIERLTIHDHPNADALELAQVGLYRAVVPKGVYKTGDYALYIPEQSILPDELIAELGLTGRLAGKAKNRVTTVRLRGEISQGIVCRPSTIDFWDPYESELIEFHYNNKINFAEELGITKWVPPIPIHMSGKVESCSDLIPWIDIESIKRYPNIFTPGEPVVATEKIHGTACLATYVTESNQLYVSSKGYGSKHLAIAESSDNAYWRAIRLYGVKAVAAQLASLYDARRIGIFGEVYGAGIQDLAYDSRNTNDIKYAVFDVAIDIGGKVTWLKSHDMEKRLAGLLPTVPTLFSGSYDEAFLLALAEGVETVSGEAKHIREGIVVRERDEFGNVTGVRKIGKIVSNSYLTRKGGTEYE